jgi:hypothetical protein
VPESVPKVWLSEEVLKWVGVSVGESKAVLAGVLAEALEPGSA